MRSVRSVGKKGPGERAHNQPPSTSTRKELGLAIAKVIELISEGSSVEAAFEAAVSEAGKTVKNIKNVYADGIQAIVDNNNIVNYRVNAKVTFVVDN